MWRPELPRGRQRLVARNAGPAPVTASSIPIPISKHQSQEDKQYRPMDSAKIFIHAADKSRISFRYRGKPEEESRDQPNRKMAVNV
ncbi:hypothetical protein [Proteiniphilum sp. X52]|uniref:hypothetical protein n=1 Tax=Proteiniphilum sp. X52 TaxID=2382159 RepID=UPI0011CEA1EB|nr:hypothetical protein [Proteiniphilum sp. X52]